MNPTINTLHVTGMSCNSCVRHIEGALGKLGGVEQATVDLEHEQVTVAYRPDATGIAEIKAAVRDAGYGVVDEVEPPKQTSRTNCCGCC